MTLASRSVTLATTNVTLATLTKTSIPVIRIVRQAQSETELLAAIKAHALKKGPGVGTRKTPSLQAGETRGRKARKSIVKRREASGAIDSGLQLGLSLYFKDPTRLLAAMRRSFETRPQETKLITVFLAVLIGLAPTTLGATKEPGDRAGNEAQMFTEALQTFRDESASFASRRQAVDDIATTDEALLMKCLMNQGEETQLRSSCLSWLTRLKGRDIIPHMKKVWDTDSTPFRKEMVYVLAETFEDSYCREFSDSNS